MGGSASYPVAFLAGLVSFISPCVLPLLPGYLSFISGSSVEDLADGAKGKQARVLLTTILFVLGFSLVFSLIGSAFGFMGSFLQTQKILTQRLAGFIIIVMGLFMIGVLKIPGLQREVRFFPKSSRLGPIGAFPLGMAFAVGWTPCIGPILASIYLLAMNDPGTGASFLLVYSLGLGIPFIVSGLLFSKMTRGLNWFKRHSVLIHRISGLILVVIGVLMFLNRWTQLVAPLQSYFQLPI